ncbi:MAG: alpha/beta fold hydrolase [Bifidobacterium sp.]|nr:alpha/beta fold hydrolase [Bifidobacterium sp.]
MSDELNESTGGADAVRPPLGRLSNVVPGRFGEKLTVTHALPSRGGARQQTNRPLFVCLHGWGSNEEDLAGMMQYVAPYNDYVSLRAPLTLQEPAPGGLFGPQPGAYSWLHDAVPSGDDLDLDAFAAAEAVDEWVRTNVDDARRVVPIGFSQGGMLATQLLKVHPERYCAAICLSGFVSPGNVPGTAPGLAALDALNIPTFYGYGSADTVIPRWLVYETEAWLEEHTWLTAHEYRGLDHSVSLEEFADLRRWLLDHDITSGLM